MAVKRRGRAAGGLGFVAKFLICLGACNVLFFAGCIWWMVSTGGHVGLGGSGSSVMVRTLQARIRELEGTVTSMAGKVSAGIGSRVGQWWRRAGHRAR